jgi:Tol biopolymer transport system component
LPVISLGLALCAAGCTERGELLGTIELQVDGSASPPTSGSGGAPSAGGAGGGAGTSVGALHFSAPQLVAAVSDPNAYDADPTFTGDLLELFFMSDRAGSKDIWTSHRSSSTDPWGAPTIVAALNSSATDEGPSISLDGLRIWFVTEREVPFRRIWQSSRPSRSDPWVTPTVVAELATSATDFGPSVDAEETTMFFGSNRPGAMGIDVFSTTRASPSLPWGPPKLVPGVNGPSDDKDPFVTEGGLVIFFTSMRRGAGDIFWSERQSTNGPFPAPVALVDINSPTAYDSDPTLSLDLTYLMFDSARSGISDIFESHAIR